MKIIVNTGRTVSQGSFVDIKNSGEYSRETSVIRLHPYDLLNLDIEEGDNVLATVKEIDETGNERYLSVVLKTCEDENLEPGTAFLPLGPYANYLVPGNTHGTGMPDFKHTIAEIVPTDKEVTSVGSLMQSIGGMPYKGQN